MQRHTKNTTAPAERTPTIIIIIGSHPFEELPLLEISSSCISSFDNGAEELAPDEGVFKRTVDGFAAFVRFVDKLK